MYFVPAVLSAAGAVVGSMPVAMAVAMTSCSRSTSPSWESIGTLARMRPTSRARVTVASANAEP